MSVQARIFFILVFLSSLRSFSALKTEIDWTKYALRLTGESDQVREQAIVQLRSTKNLEKKLRAELEGPKWSLALDVISALDMRKLADDILQVGRKTHNSFFYLTLNTLLTDESQPKILSEYRKILFCGSSILSTCSRTEPEAVVLLETLSRAGEKLTEGEMRTFFKPDSWPEVQAAALEHARRIYKHVKREDEALFVIRLAFSSHYTQIQEHALFLSSQLPQSLKSQIAKFMTTCPGELSISAKQICQNLRTEL